MQVAMFSIAVILIGGASVTNAKINHAITGVVLFHMIFIVSPTAGKALFGARQDVKNIIIIRLYNNEGASHNTFNINNVS